MDAAAEGPELECSQGARGPMDANMDASGTPPGPEMLAEPGEPAEPRPEALARATPEELEPCKPEKQGLEETEPPGPEEPEPCETEKLEETEPPGPKELEPCDQEKLEETEPPRTKELEPCEPKRLKDTEPPRPEELEPCETKKLGLGVMETPGPEEPSEMEVTAGPWVLSGPSETEVAAGRPSPSVFTPAAGGTGEEAASGKDGATGEAPPAAGAEEAPGPTAPSSPGSAERRNGEAPEEGDVAEEDEEERQERAELLEELRGMAAERERLRQASTRLLLRLGELLRLGPAERREWAALGAGESKLYAQRWLRQLQEEGERASAASRQRETRTRAEWDAFLARKKAVAVASINRQLGSREAVPPVADVVDRIQARERDTEQRVREARVENIKLKHEIQNLETILKAQGDLVKGQHGIDFKHMKKEDQKHSENIDNLSHEILKLKEKVSNTVHTLGQVREKLHFLEAENECRRAELMHLETVLAQKTQILTRRKQARDRVRANNLKLQQKCGLLGNEILLRDFEEKVATAELLNQQLETLKRHHAGLILDCKGIQKKIKEANSSFLAEDDSRKKSMEKK